MKQERTGGSRRWFESDGFHLVVWYKAAGAVAGFQICYDLGAGEHALTWRKDGGLAHDAVDAGDDTPFSNLTPILVPNGAVPWPKLTEAFEKRSGSLETSLRQLVLTVLQQGGRG